VIPNVEEHGFTVVAGVLGLDDRAELSSALGTPRGAGLRGVLGIPAVARLSRSEALVGLARSHLSGEPLPVRALYLNKSSEANWLVPWHQDLTIAVRARVEVLGFGPWSTKDGVPHVQPPIGLMEQMLAIRVHLDDADESNGALRVLPGTHRLGRLTPQRVQELRATRTEVRCCVAAGDVLLMRPLLLHASDRCTSLRRRRVLHIEYAAGDLPGGLEWYEAS
jgi:hypothetical protein